LTLAILAAVPPNKSPRAIYRIEKGVVSATISAEQRRMSQIIGFVGPTTFVNGRSISAWTSCISTWIPRHYRAMY
jgi:hypothetical protein